MSNPVVGTNSNGVGVTGTGSTYGVAGDSTAAFAGVSGTTTTGAPALLGQSKGTGPALLAICGLGSVVDTLLDGTIDAFAVKQAATYPDYAGIFVGAIAVSGAIAGQSGKFEESLTAQSLTAQSGTFSQGLTANDLTATNSLTAKNLKADSASISGDLTSKNLTLSGTFKGDSATFSGDLTAKDVILSGADCAEEFDIAGADPLEPGTVVVFDHEAALSSCSHPYSKRVAGVVSGAGDFRPGVILDRRQTARRRAAIALVGKVFCKVDAGFSPIEVGDLLTTSATPGHAMKAVEPGKAFGSVIGKALSTLEQGCGLIPVLVCLQ